MQKKLKSLEKKRQKSIFAHFLFVIFQNQHHFSKDPMFIETQEWPKTAQKARNRLAKECYELLHTYSELCKAKDIFLKKWKPTEKPKTLELE